MGKQMISRFSCSSGRLDSFKICGLPCESGGSLREETSCDKKALSPNRLTHETLNPKLHVKCKICEHVMHAPSLRSGPCTLSPPRARSPARAPLREMREHEISSEHLFFIFFPPGFRLSSYFFCAWYNG